MNNVLGGAKVYVAAHDLLRCTKESSVSLSDRYYAVSARVVPANRETTLAIRPLFGHSRFAPDRTYRAACYPTEEFAQRNGWTPGIRIPVVPEEGVIRLTCFFEGEQEHVIVIEDATEEQPKDAAEFRVYSLEDDLYARRPYKGDLHIHSYRSDGRESPAYVAGACRRMGLDFMAVTDHSLYTPSLEAQRAFAYVPHDLKIFPGEEVHPPDNPVHMINFGGSYSITGLFQRDEQTYREEVARIEASASPFPAGVDSYQYASCVWCFDQIRAAGGLGIFCHPYWFTQHRYTPSGALTSYLFETQPYDAFELIGGFHRFEIDSNTLQVARYHQERARGRTIPIVGVSDAHGCERGELFGWYYTIVFAPSLELGDIIQAIKTGYSVAVEALPGETARAYGPFRLVKYALYCMRELFPHHDALCAEEGRLMLACAGGEADTADRLAHLSGQTRAWRDRCWGKGA